MICYVQSFLKTIDFIEMKSDFLSPLLAKGNIVSFPPRASNNNNEKEYTTVYFLQILLASYRYIHKQYAHFILRYYISSPVIKEISSSTFLNVLTLVVSCTQLLTFMSEP